VVLVVRNGPTLRSNSRSHILPSTNSMSESPHPTRSQHTTLNTNSLRSSSRHVLLSLHALVRNMLLKNISSMQSSALAICLHMDSI